MPLRQLWSHFLRVMQRQSHCQGIQIRWQNTNKFGGFITCFGTYLLLSWSLELGYGLEATVVRLPLQILCVLVPYL